MVCQATKKLLVTVLLFVALAQSTNAETRWPGWRGPHGDGHSTETTLPVQWTEQNVVWKADLPGRGQSSPVVWDDHIFLTASEDDGRQRLVLCLSRKTGDIVWKQVAWTGDPEKVHVMNPWASATCVTDGQRVVAFFGRGGLHCFDMDGKKLWSRELGLFEGPWGTAASPVIVGDLVIQNCDADDEAYLLGVDKHTGETIWKTPRTTVRGWSTPILVETGARQELVMNGHTGVNAYDPATGKELWYCKGDNGRGTPTVAPYKDMLIAVSGRPGDMFAMRAGGNGTVNASHEVWRTSRRGGRDLPSPTVVGDYLVVVSLKPGLATCYEAATGKELHKIRLDGNFSASPIVANGLLFIPNENGETFALRPGKQLEIVARSKVNSDSSEIFRASLTPSDGQWLLRSDRVLYCIGK